MHAKSGWLKIDRSFQAATVITFGEFVSIYVRETADCLMIRCLPGFGAKALQYVFVPSDIKSVFG
jgi:hypothetical protein